MKYEVRCIRCNRLFFKVLDIGTAYRLASEGVATVEIKCPSCGKLQTIKLRNDLTEKSASV